MYFERVPGWTQDVSDSRRTNPGAYTGLATRFGAAGVTRSARRKTVDGRIYDPFAVCIFDRRDLIQGCKKVNRGFTYVLLRFRISAVKVLQEYEGVSLGSAVFAMEFSRLTRARNECLRQNVVCHYREARLQHCWEGEISSIHLSQSMRKSATLTIQENLQFLFSKVRTGHLMENERLSS